MAKLKYLPSVLIEIRVNEILQHNNAGQWNQVSICGNAMEARVICPSADVSESSSCVRGNDFLRTKRFHFVQNTDVSITSRSLLKLRSKTMTPSYL